MDGRQLLKVSVGFMDGAEDLIDFIYGFIHTSLEYTQPPIIYKKMGIYSQFRSPICSINHGRGQIRSAQVSGELAEEAVELYVRCLTRALTMLKEAAACSSNPTSPTSLKYFPAQMPSSSGDKMSSDTADSSSTFDEILCAPRYETEQNSYLTVRVMEVLCKYLHT